MNRHVALVIAVACLLIAVFAMADSYIKESLVEIPISGPGDLMVFEEMKLVAEHYDGERIFLRATDEQYAALIKQGFSPKVIVEDIVAHHRAMMATDEYDDYHSHSDLITEMNALAAANPTLVSVEVVGQSVQGRDIILVKVSDNVCSDEQEPEIYFAGNIHGDEKSALEVAIYLVNYLVENYGTDATVTELVNTREIFVNPMVNPDGSTAGSRYNNNGVDLNRDSGYMWAGDGNSTAPFSQPETQIIHNILEAHHFAFASSYHSGTLFFSYPWSYSYDNTPDEDAFEVLGDGYTEVNGYPVEQGSSGMYRMHGSTKDTYYGAYGIYGWSIEVSYDKTPSFSEIEGICDENIGGQLFLIEKAGQGVGGVVTSSDKDEPLPARLYVDGRWIFYTDTVQGDFHHYMLPGTYDITVCATGYECDIHTAVTVVADQQTNLDTVLDPESIPNPWGWRFIYSDMPNSEDATTEAFRSLGPPNGDFLSIGNGGYVVIDMGPDGVIDDIAGNDITIYEADSGGDEGFILYGSNSWDGPWSQIGTGSGTVSLDLNGSGLASVRFFKIEDSGKQDDSKGALDGYDLDAIGGASAIMASFTANVTSGEAPLEVTFASGAIGNITSYLWNFGDGETSTAENPVHTYTDAGDYDVSLTVTGTLGSDTETKPNYISVIWGQPAANFAADPVTGTAPMEVDFTDFSTGSINSWSWEFGDGGTSSDAEPTYTYDDPGTYSVTLSVSGPGGSNAKTKDGYITVRCPAPEADFEGDTLTGEAPLSVNFSNLTQAATGCYSSCAWDFGDGETSVEEDPTHVYQSSGTYTVKLMAMGDGGSDTEEKQAYVTVTGGDDDDDDDNDTGDDDDDDTGGDDDDDDDDDSGGCA